MALLEAQGWSVWWDTRIIGGERWDAVIEREIEAARCVVVVWTPRSLKREWVNVESHHGHNRGILVSILVRVSKPPLAFSLRQAHNLTDWDGITNTEEIAKFLKAVWEKLGGSSPRPQLRSLPQPDLAPAAKPNPGGGWTPALAQIRRHAGSGRLPWRC